MASAPATTGNTPKYRPLFKRVAQNDLKDGIHCADFIGELACIATITSQTLDEIRACALKNGLPGHGPFWITEDLIQKVLAHYGWKATEWKAVMTPLAGLPDIAIVMIDYDEDTEIGRSVVYQRAASKNDPKGYEEYVLDPAYWMTSHEPVTTDIKGLCPRWYIGVYPMPYPTSGIPKAPPAPAAKK